jgi:hypothetical protein
MKMRGSTEPPLCAISDYDELNSIWAALEARPSLLASRLRDGSASPEERKVAADLIEMKIKPRRPKSSSRQKRLELAEYVAFLENVLPHLRHNADVQRKVVISLAAEHHKVSARHVYNALNEFDQGALAESERMYRKLSGDYEEPPIDPDPKLCDILKDVDHDVLVQIIADFLHEIERFRATALT